MMEYKKIKIVFFGTPDFATASLRALVDAGCDVRAVVTAPDKPAGRGHKLLQSDVKRYALEAELPLLQPTNLKDSGFLEELRGIGADMFIVIAFRMLPEAVWKMPPLGTFNIHGSLLPDYRGAAPINHAVMNGETMTGVTSFLLSAEIDKGAILLQKSTPIGADESVGEVYDRLMKMGAELTLDTLRGISEGSVTPREQPEGVFHQAPKIFKDTCRLDWNRPARMLHNHVRGLSPYPGAYTGLLLNDGRELECKMLKTRVGAHTRLRPGAVEVAKDGFGVACADGVMLEVIELKPSGRQVMRASEFVKGYKPVCCR